MKSTTNQPHTEGSSTQKDESHDGRKRKSLQICFIVGMLILFEVNYITITSKHYGGCSESENGGRMKRDDG